MSAAKDRTFAEDAAFLEKHTDSFVLKRGKAALVVCPQYQGRAMTSTADAEKGMGAGWLNYSLIESGKTGPHINVFGGEDRFWLGPEGGQFSIYFKDGSPFDLQHWQTPAAIDTEPYRVAERTASMARFVHECDLVNYMGRTFKVGIDRTVKMLDPATVVASTGASMPDGVQGVAYCSDNTIVNRGPNAWTEDTGALSIWILCMFKPGPHTTIVVPFNKRGTGKVVNDTYFGKVPADRLKQGDGVLFFKADGQYRSKIGLSPSRSRPVMGSYDPDQNMLTLATYTKPPRVTKYVNSMWEIQEKPYGGDVVNSYNDGPPAPGKKPLGPFYELESSSPAAFLRPKGAMRHVHTTVHLVGPRAKLDAIARKALGVGLVAVTKAFG